MTWYFVGILTVAFHVTAQDPAEGSPKSRSEERVILKKSDFNPPVSIVTVKTRKGKIEFGKPFADDDNWLKGLTARVANASGLSVTYIGVEVLIRRAERPLKEPGALWHLEYGDNPFRYKAQEAVPSIRVKPLLTGDSVEIGLTNYDYNHLDQFLKDLAFSSGTNHIELRVTTVGFSDGTAWFGRMLRRDFNYPGGWGPIKNPDPNNPRSDEPQASSIGSDDSWLALDRNGNGLIGDGNTGPVIYDALRLVSTWGMGGAISSRVM